MNLPKFLVQRIGAEKVRELYGLDPIDIHSRAHKTAKSRRVRRFVESTKRTEFTSGQIAQLLQDITPCEVAAVLRAMDTVEPTYPGKQKVALWRKVSQAEVAGA